MWPSRYSLRSLLVAVTLIAIGIGALTWLEHKLGRIEIDNATAEQANRVLRGFVSIPAKATEVRVDYTPMSMASIRFYLSASETRAWCERNNWKVIPDGNFNRFEIKVTDQRGGGVWFEGKTDFVLISD